MATTIKLILTLFLSSNLFISYAHQIPPVPAKEIIQTLKANSDFDHQTGESGSQGWQVNYKKHKPGYVLSSSIKPLTLDSGLYRFTFTLRRGQYPSKGLLYQSFGLFRIEIWDLTHKEKLADRNLQIADLPSAGRYHERWIEVSLVGKEKHAIEARVYWPGLVNGEVAQIEVEKYPTPNAQDLEYKAIRLGQRLQSQFLENGFVVSRKSDGQADETGDAATYTGWYAASLSWKYRVTKDSATLMELENAMSALHTAIQGSYDRPLLARFVDDNYQPFSRSSSKDSYAAFFFATAATAPLIKNPTLKTQMSLDAKRIADRFLKEGLRLAEGQTEILTLAPYFSERVIKNGISSLVSQRRHTHRALKAIKKANTLIPFGDLWPGSKDVVYALKKRDEEKLFQLVIPTVNGLLNLASRLREILREQYRTDLFLRKSNDLDYPGKMLEAHLTDALARFPLKKSGRRVEKISDVKVLGSNALISLALIRTAAALNPDDRFLSFYKSNLFGGEALLQTALNWNGFDETLLRLTAGNPVADRERRGYLSVLSLYALLQLETDPIVRKKYLLLLDRWWTEYRHDDNPMAAALVDAVKNEKKNMNFILRSLDLYPEDRRGYGKDYWSQKGHEVGEAVGGGSEEKFSFEPIPVSHRPKDSFLWQRNTRRLSGDEEKEYPPTDYLFLYWFSRANGLFD